MNWIEKNRIISLHFNTGKQAKGQSSYLRAKEKESPAVFKTDPIMLLTINYDNKRLSLIFLLTSVLCMKSGDSILYFDGLFKNISLQDHAIHQN